MWLFTKYGFYSVVQDKADAKRIQVRGRVKDDIERLVTFAKQKLGAETPEIISTPKADYAYRIVFDRFLWERLASALTADIDYTNFKDAVHGEPDRDSSYLEVWSTMNDLQRRRKKLDG
jgi:hypothetical protein